MSLPPVMQLNAAHRNALRQHFTTLEGDDLRLRFGRAVRPEGLEAYANTLDFERDAVSGVFANNLELAGVAHLALHSDDAEFGVSVLPEHRDTGIGKALFERAIAFARNHLIETLCMHCLAENAAMMHIARSSGMKIVGDGDGNVAYLQLPTIDPASLADELLATRVALFDFMLKSQLAFIRLLFCPFAGHGNSGGNDGKSIRK